MAKDKHGQPIPTPPADKCATCWGHRGYWRGTQWVPCPDC